jgi:hypothetical protein
MGGMRPAARNVALSRSFYLKIRNTACHDAAIRVVLGGVRYHVLRRRSRAARQLVSVRVHHALQLVHLRRPSLAMLQEILGCAEMMVHRLACSVRETKHASRPPLSHEKRRTPCTSSTKADT